MLIEELALSNLYFSKVGLPSRCIMWGRDVPQHGNILYFNNDYNERNYFFGRLL